MGGISFYNPQGISPEAAKSPNLNVNRMAAVVFLPRVKSTLGSFPELGCLYVDGFPFGGDRAAVVLLGHCPVGSQSRWGIVPLGN